MSDPRSTQVRVCARCKKPAVVCTLVTQHLLNGVLPIGSTYAHACRDCKATFETESALRAVWNFLWGGLWFAFGLGAALFVGLWAFELVAGRTGLPSLRDAAISGVMLLMLAAGIYVSGRSVVRFANLLRNPVAQR